MLLKDAEGKSNRYGVSVDWWSFGVFIYELLKGKGPFRGPKALSLDPDADVAIDKATMEMEVEYPPDIFSPDTIDLLRKLLERDPSKRLGTKNASEIREHPFFNGKIDFGLLELGRIQPPWRPNANDINALSQDEIGTFEEAKVKLTPQEQESWKKWDFKSKSVIQYEQVEHLMWEEKFGPTTVAPPPVSYHGYPSSYMSIFITCTNVSRVLKYMDVSILVTLTNLTINYLHIQATSTGCCVLM